MLGVLPLVLVPVLVLLLVVLHPWRLELAVGGGFLWVVCSFLQILFF